MDETTDVVVLCDERIPAYVKGKIHKMIVQTVMLYEVETEMKRCRYACCHTLRDHVKNDNIMDRLMVKNITERYRRCSP